MLNFPLALPKPLEWTDKVAVWLAPEGDHYVDKVIAHPAYFHKVNFTLGEKKTVQWKNESIEVFGLKMVSCVLCLTLLFLLVRIHPD